MAVREIGQVIELKEGRVVLKIERTDSCSSCDAKESCVLSQRKEWLVELANTLDAKVGELVEIELSSRVYLASSAIIFIVPIFLMIIFYLIGDYIFSQNIGVIFSAFGLLAGMVVAMFFNRGKGAFEYKMIEKKSFDSH